MQALDDTIAAIATPLGEGGLGIIRLSGPGALGIGHTIFEPRTATDLRQAGGYTCYPGRIVGHSQIDEVILTVFRAPHSYTGEDVVEISAHGSPYILQEILQLCLRGGARLAAPGEFTQRAFLNGKMDLTQAEAVAELIRARSEKAHSAALAQLEGSLGREVRSLREQILSLLAHVEVGLDHTDEDHAFLQRETLVERIGAILEGVDRILASGRVGQILRQGLRVALVGRPNVGKSSLMNALLRSERAIVTPIAGTTRDTIEEQLTWDGLPVVLTDTAGLRENTTDPVESIGIERAKRALEAADMVIGLFDASEPLQPEDEAVARACASQPHLWAVNKTDLAERWAPEALRAFNGNAPVVRLSARTGAGLCELVKTVKRLAFVESPSSTQAQWILNRRHQDALERGRAALDRAQEAARNDDFEECVALELQTALQVIGEIVGETPTEELLGQIFSQFCVGK